MMQNVILSPVAVDELIDRIACEVEARIIKHQDPNCLTKVQQTKATTQTDKKSQKKN